MAEYKIPYPGVNNSLRHFRVQVIHSLPYAVRNLPRDLKTPEQIFYWCKNKFRYRNDPKLVELFQTVRTLLQNNDIGEPGQGDCDDATILCLTMLLINGFIDCGIVLAGRSKTNATHIYAYVIDNGNRKLLDLTTTKFNTEGGTGNYTHRQYIPFKISKSQLDMFLQLADGGKPKKRLRVRKLTPQQKEQGIYIPSKNVFVPVDHFDKLPIKHAKQTLLSEGYELDQLSEYLSGRKERKERKAYRKEKKNIKLDKKRANVEKKQATAQKRRDKGTSKKIKASAKVIKAKKAPSGQGMKIFDKVGNIATKVLTRKKEGEEEEDYDNMFARREVEREEDNLDYDPNDAENFEPEAVEGEDIESSEEEVAVEEELQDGINSITTKDVLSLGTLLLGAYLEKRSTKRVA